MSERRFFLPEQLNNLALACGFPLYVVGGACRDFLAGLSQNRDYDICAPVSAERFVAAAQRQGFTVHSVYSATGTVKLTCGGDGYEFACFRTDEYVRGHAPSKVFETRDITADAMRRDFKCNAVYYDIAAEKFVDPLGGIADIRNKKMDCVRDSSRVFSEDGLRLMRLCRQAAQTGFSPTDDCLKGARDNAFRIGEISAERVLFELEQILLADRKHGIKDAHYKGLKLLEQTGVLEFILPELWLGKGMEQRADYHDYDVLEHSLRCVLYASPNIRLAALLHDVGKPYCKITNGNFYRHEIYGEEIAEKICARLRVSRAETQKIKRLVRWHMYDGNGITREAKVRKAIAANADIWQETLDLRQADFSACKDDLSEAPGVTRWKAIYQKMQQEGVPFNLKQLAVNGDDLLSLGIRGARIGEILQELLTDCVVGNLKNEKGVLLRRAASLAGFPKERKRKKR